MVVLRIHIPKMRYERYTFDTIQDPPPQPTLPRLMRVEVVILERSCPGWMLAAARVLVGVAEPEAWSKHPSQPLS